MDITVKMTKTVKGFCNNCNEVTPHNPVTTGHCCQVCLNTNSFENAVVDYPLPELVAFWQLKFYQLRTGVAVPEGIAWASDHRSGQKVFFNAPWPTTANASIVDTPGLNR